MTHDELLAKIESFNKVTTEGMERKAIRAVVQLHKPFMGNTLELCYECMQLRKVNDPVVTYPCHTIQAIEKELG